MERALFGELPVLGFNPVGMLLDPYHYEKKSYYSRPYIETGQAFAEIPIAGPLMAASIGQLVKPTLSMHASQFRAERQVLAGVLGAWDLIQHPPSLQALTLRQLGRQPYNLE